MVPVVVVRGMVVARVAVVDGMAIAVGGEAVMV